MLKGVMEPARSRGNHSMCPVGKRCIGHLFSTNMPTIAKYTHGYFPSEQTHKPHIWPSLSHITTIPCIKNLVLAASAFTNNKGDSSIPTPYRTYIIELYMNEPTPYNLHTSLQTGNFKLNDINYGPRRKHFWNTNLRSFKSLNGFTTDNHG